MLENVIIAIDTYDIEMFKNILNTTKDYFLWYKIHSIFLSQHEYVVKILKTERKKIFLDLKFFDTPATIEKHIKAISRYCDMFTFHLLSGKESIKMASNIAKEEGVIPVGVSILTSLSDENIREIGITSSVSEEVLKLVSIGIEEGITHFVCSPHEIMLIKEKFPSVKLLTPGIRISRPKHDQKRVMTPKEALSLGADFIVMGREIIESKDINTVLQNL